MSLSLNKFIEKLGENINRTSHQELIQNGESRTMNKLARPGSPFILLLSEGDEEFNFVADEQKDTNNFPNVFDQDSVGSSLHNGSSSNLSTDGNESAGLFTNKVVSDVKSNEDNTLSDQDYTSDETYDFSMTTDTFEEETALKEDERRSFRDNPMTKEQFEKLFDRCGRLVNEHDLRKAIFKGGVDENIRKNVWQFLFELYPFNTTAREREILMIEQTLRYEAMKIRWKILLRSLVNEYEGVWYCPKWYSACPKNAKEHMEQMPRNQASVSVSSVEESSIIIDNLKAKTLVRTLILPTESEFDLSNLSEQNSDIELQCFDLICHENPEEPHLISNNACDFVPSSYDEKIDQTHLLSQVKNNEETVRIKLEMNRVSSSSDENSNERDDQGVNVLNFECNEVDSISEALADAMLDVGNQTNPSCESERDCVIPKQCEEFDILHTECIQAKNTIQPVDTMEYKETQSEDIHFPNPFRFSKDYVNNQESLYSKSENFKSLDIMKFEVSVTVNKNEQAEVHKVDENATTLNCSYQEDNTNNTQNELSENLAAGHDTINLSHVKSEGSETNGFEEESNENETYSMNNSIVGQTNDGNLNNDIFHLVLDKPVAECPVILLDQISTNVHDHINYNQVDEIDGCQPIEEDIELQKINSVVHKKDTIHERRESLARSPTGERLENIPPWIAQIIKASTPGSASKPMGQNFQNSIENFISPVKNDSYDPEILDIVENANRFLKEQQAKSGQSTPLNSNSTKNSPKHKRYEEVCETTHNLLRKSFSTPAEIFRNVTPKLKFLVSFDTVNSEDITSQGKLVLTKCPYCNFDENVTQEVALPVSSLGEEQLKFMKLQAQVFAARQPYNEKLISSSVRVIDKDVPRTDRELSLFSGDDNPGLIKLRDALMTYAFFHPEVGYAQGMNDIMSRFLVVMDTEAEAYWMFVNYMEVFKDDFMEEGMLRKIALVEQLLMKMDRELYDYLLTMDMGLMFCHRWLLLNFKREFEYMEAIRLFEITSSRHLEVYSFAAELERSKERAKEFKKDSTGSHLEEIYLSAEYPYDIFVCVTMLMECRHMIMDTTDLTAVYEILSNLPTTLDLQNILRKSEELFYRFCRKTVGDCFQVIDELEVQDFDDRKKQFSFTFR